MTSRGIALGWPLGSGQPFVGQTPAPTPAPTPTPTPTPAPMTKPASEGDSITADANSGIRMWMTANFSDSSQNFAIGGSGLGGPTDTPNPSGLTMFARLPSVIAYNPSDLITSIGANDFDGMTAPQLVTWKSNMITYWANARSGCSNLKRIFAGEVLPRGPGTTGTDYVTFNANRADVNVWLRSQVGVTIDAIIPYGTHPVLGPDAAAITNLYDTANLHPQAAGQAIMRLIVNAVLDSVVARSTATEPTAFAFADVTNAALSTEFTPTNVVLLTGMGVGHSAVSSVTGGTLARGTGSFSSSGQSFMNGDAPIPKASSSGSYTAAVNAVVTIGATSDTFTVTTGANVTPVSYSTVAGDEVNVGFGGNTATFAARTLVPGRLFFHVYSGNSALQPDSFKLTKSAVDYPATKIDSVAEDSWWYVDVPASGSYVPSANRSGGVMSWVAWLGIIATDCTTHGSGQKLAAGAYNNPVNFPGAQPVNANELGIIMTATGSTVTRNDGSTQRATFTVTDSNRPGTISIATLPSTATPSFNLSSGTAVGGGYAITAKP
jgi:roadblock/LC7 domain-containing protein